MLGVYEFIHSKVCHHIWKLSVSHETIQDLRKGEYSICSSTIWPWGWGGCFKQFDEKSAGDNPTQSSSRPSTAAES